MQFDEAIKWVAGGGSFGTALAIFYIWKIAPRLYSLEMTILRQQRIKLLEMAQNLAKHPALHAEAMDMLSEVEASIKGDNAPVQ